MLLENASTVDDVSPTADKVRIIVETIMTGKMEHLAIGFFGFIQVCFIN
jgi:hypothetical protein